MHTECVCVLLNYFIFNKYTYVFIYIICMCIYNLLLCSAHAPARSLAAWEAAAPVAAAAALRQLFVSAYFPSSFVSFHIALGRAAFQQQDIVS